MRFFLKRLTASDLTLFAAKFGTINRSKQKAINLDADVFVDRLFPALRTEANRGSVKIPLGVSLFGPSGAPAHEIARKVTKGTSSYKNWRLNGELIPAPLDDPARYDALDTGGVGLFGFEGVDRPTRLSLYLFSRAEEKDAPMVEVLDHLLGKASIAEVADLAAVRASAPEDHPLAQLFSVPSTEIEPFEAYADAAVADREVKGRRTTKDQVRDMMGRAAEIGDLGEEVVYDHLVRLFGEERVVWHSRDENALASYDILLKGSSDALDVLVEVKATTGRFESPFFLSAAEAQRASAAASPYMIYRVSQVESDHPKLRVADVRGLAQEALKNVALGKGMTITGFVLSPGEIDVEWEAEDLSFEED